MKTIYKYQLKTDEGVQEIPMPTGARILTVALQNGIPTLWVEVDPDEEPDARRFCIYPTGQPIGVENPVDRNYIGTFQIGGLIDTLVGHVFELT